MGLRVTGKRGIPRSPEAARGGGEEDTAESGLIELRAMVPNKEEMSDAYGQQPAGRSKGKYGNGRRGMQGGGPSSEFWV